APPPPNKCPRVEEENKEKEDESKENSTTNTIEETLTEDNGAVAIKNYYKFDEVDVELYGESILNPPSLYREIVNYSFQAVDRLINLGPMGQITCGEVPCLAPGNTDPTDEALTHAQSELHHVELMACITRSFGITTEKNPLSSGGIALLHTSVRPRGLTAFELPEYMSLWSLYGPPILSPVHSAPVETDPTVCTDSLPKKQKAPKHDKEEKKLDEKEKIDEDKVEPPVETDENLERLPEVAEFSELLILYA
ncbi:unnamed protein product, partial [Trichobilharzia regenti]